jgi:excisionase family DNA binding protein
MQNVSLKAEQPSILTLENVADYLRVHPSTIYRMLKKKQLPAFKIGRDWRFNRESLDRWCSKASLTFRFSEGRRTCQHLNW